MKFKSLACTGISFFSLLQPIVSLSATKQPNILFFMVDDMGWQDTSVPFADEKTLFNNLYETPNMERLARMGVKFTNAYAASVSSPSRCSLMTGANNAGWRIDYFCVSDCLKDKIEDAKILTDVMGSDHCPIELDIAL